MPRVAFDPLICFGENGAFPHHETGDSKLKPGDSVIIDTGHRWGMYCSDMTRTVFFRSCTDEQRNVYDIVNKANRAGESIARPGIALRDVDAAARNVIIAAGYGEFFTHRTGHGIGIDVHEPPDVAATNSQLAEVGMVFSVEPGIYLPGKFWRAHRRSCSYDRKWLRSTQSSYARSDNSGLIAARRKRRYSACHFYLILQPPWPLYWYHAA